MAGVRCLQEVGWSGQGGKVQAYREEHLSCDGQKKRWIWQHRSNWKDLSVLDAMRCAIAGLN